MTESQRVDHGDAMTKSVHCAVEQTVAVIGGKWKPLILHHLFFEGTQRFNELLRKTGAPRQALTVQLRELERDGILSREVFPEVEATGQGGNPEETHPYRGGIPSRDGGMYPGQKGEGGQAECQIPGDSRKHGPWRRGLPAHGVLNGSIPRLRQANCGPEPSPIR